MLLRHYGQTDRARIAEELARVCRARGLVLLVGRDEELARRVGADGLHLPERAVPEFSREAWPGLVTAAAHSPKAITAAQLRGVDAVLLSPVFATATHPGVAPLGVTQAMRWIAGASLPVYALGGIEPANARSLVGSGAAGIACLGAFADAAG